jgi:hypothetical protein
MAVRAWTETAAGGPRPDPWVRRVGVGLAAVLMVLILAGCQVTTSVMVSVQQNGTGSVTVVVTADRAAVLAVGGIAGQLQDSDLAAAGWRVTTASGSDGTEVVTLTHGFSELSQVPTILAEVGRAPTGAHTPLFAVEITQTRTFFKTTTTAVGRVDLTCGLACFGDAGLKRAYGSELGLAPAGLEGPGGTAATERDFRFSLVLRIPGKTGASDAPPGQQLRWTPVLGRQTPISARSTAIDVTHVAEASAGGGATVIGLAILMVAVFAGVRAGRRRRRAGRTARPDHP